jgi:hypothetical protein
MIFESGDNDQEGWIFRSKNATTPKQVLNIQPEGTFTFLGNNILHAGNHAAGSAFTPTLTGANVLSSITTNASGHVTALTTRALTAADIGAAPASTSGNYVQNLAVASGIQTANFSINGTGYAGTGGATPLLFSNNSAGQLNLVGGATGAGSLRGGEIVLLGGSWGTTPGEILFRTGTGGSGAQQPERMRIDAAGDVGIGTTTPSSKLEVNGATTISGGANLSLKAASDDPGDLVFTDGSNVEYSRIYNSAGGAGLHISTGSTPTPRLTVSSAGNVGIATTAPAATLHVNGTFRSAVADLLNTSLIRGGGAQDIANTAYIRFMDNTATNRKGYVGDASNGNNDMYLTSDSGGVRLVPLNGTSGSLYIQGSTMDYNGSQLYLNNGTRNQVLFNSVGIGAPAFTSRSIGTKVILYPALSTAASDYAMGIETSHIWSSVPQNASNVGFKWYGGITQIGHLDGTGNLTLSGQVQATSFFQSSLRSLKKDIQPFTASALDIFKKVQVRTFKFKADATGKTNIGFIADEVPDEMATPKRNGVDQASTVALLVKAVQELTEQNSALQEKINALEQQFKQKGVQH